MDEAARLPQPQFSGPRSELRARLERALEELRDGADATAALEVLQCAAEHAQAEGALAELYAELMSGSNLADVPRAARLELYLQAAWSCASHDHLETATLRAASLALELSPADERALAIAEPLLLDAEQYTQLADLYAVAATAAGTEERARRLLERALNMLSPLPSATPAVVALKERLAQLATLRDSDEALCAVARSASGAEQAAALIKLGERWLAAGGFVERLAALKLEIERIDSDAALDVLERLFDQADDHARLERTLERRWQLEPSAAGRARWLEKLAEFWLERRGEREPARRRLALAAEQYEQGGEADDAARVCERLLALDAKDAGAASTLVRLRAAAGDFAGVADAFSVLLQSADDSRAHGALLLAIADDAARAGAVEELSELTDSVLWRLNEDDRELGATLLRTSARLFTDLARYDEAAELYRRLLADHAEAQDQALYQALIDAHPSGQWRSQEQRWLFEWQQHHSPSPEQVLLAWARYEEQELGDPDAALAVLARAAELAPDHAELWERLTRLRLAEGDGAGALAAASELQRLGREVDDELLEPLLEQEPATRWALDRVKLTLSAAARWPALFALYDRAIDATGDETERARLLDEAAIAARDVARDRERAVAYWERHAELVAGDARVDAALERLYAQAGNRRGLINHIKRRYERARPGEEQALLLRLAELALEEGELEEAIDAAESLRACGADDAGLLERTLTRALGSSGDARAQAAGCRAARLLREGRVSAAERARLLRAELSLVAGEERRALWLELARLCEKELADPDGAFDAARELFVTLPGEKERKRLEKLSKKTGRYKELCEAYVSASSRPQQLAERRALLLRAADVAERELQDRGRAVCLLRQMYELSPERAASDFEALRRERANVDTAFEALCWLLEESGRFRELGDELSRAAERARSVELYQRLARLQAHQLQAPADAVRTFLTAEDANAAAEVFLREPPLFGEQPEIALELSRRLLAAGAAESALFVLRHQLYAYEQRSTAQRKLVQLELVSVLRTTGALDAAASELADAARRYPTDADVQRACAAAAAGRGDWEGAERCYRALLLLLHGRAGEPGADCRAPVYVALAHVKRQRREPEEAEELLESAFEAALGSAAELTALAESLLGAEQWRAAERACSALLELASDLPTAAAALDGAARLLLHRPSVELLERAGATARGAAERLDQLASGEQRCRLLAACVALLPLSEAEPLLRQREAELTATARVEAELALARRLLEGADAEQARAVAERLESLTRLGDVPATAWSLLASAWSACEDDDKLALALAAWLEREPLSAVALERALKCALARQELALALDYADRCRTLGASTSTELLVELRRQCVRAGKTERAVRLLVQEAARERTSGKRAALLLEAATLLFAAGERVAALDLASEARSLDPSSAEVVLLLAKLALADGAREQALGLLITHAEAKERRRGKPLARVLRLAADLLLERDELGEALPLLQEAHQLDKTDLDTALLLGLLAVDLDRLETAASALRVLIAQREVGSREGTAPRSLNLAQGYFQLARIEHHHGKRTNAKRMALRALEEAPTSLPARRLLDQLSLS